MEEETEAIRAKLSREIKVRLLKKRKEELEGKDSEVGSMRSAKSEVQEESEEEKPEQWSSIGTSMIARKTRM